VKLLQKYRTNLHYHKDKQLQHLAYQTHHHVGACGAFGTELSTSQKICQFLPRRTYSVRSSSEGKLSRS